VRMNRLRSLMGMSILPRLAKDPRVTRHRADRQALREMAKRTFDVVTCPRTKESCAFSKLRKVYIS
jgi:hypothetical protein